MAASSGAPALVSLDEISVSFRDGVVEAQVLDGLSLELHQGETVSLIGVSGSGKSTLLGVVAGLLRPASGSIAFNGRDITAQDDAGWAALRAERIGFVGQSGNLIPFLTATENVELAARFTRRERRRTRATELLDELGLAHRRRHVPRQLSGGEAQRVGVAVALANDPELLLADEATGQLDSTTASEVMDVIFESARARRLSVLFVTHNDAVAARAERQLQLVAGRVIAV